MKKFYGKQDSSPLMSVHPSRMLAVIFDPAVLGGFALQLVSSPALCANEALVRVAAVSVGYSDVEQALASGAGALRPGCDLAGTVEVAAKDGSGPEVGARVAGVVRAGAWAQFAAVPSDALAKVPESVSFAQAAALPTDGLTALYGLDKGGLLAAKRVLVTAAAGGTGLFAVQLAHLSGARVAAVVAVMEHEALLEEYGADHVVVEDVAAAEPFGPYHLVLVDAMGGPSLTPALTFTVKGGICVLYGTARTSGAVIDERALVSRSTRLQGLTLFNELEHNPACTGLQRLLDLVKSRALQPHIELEDAWTEIGAVARRLVHGNLVGRAVLHL